MSYKSLFSLVVVGCALSGIARGADEFFNSNGVKIRYVTAGKGEAVVLIHGWMGDSSMWGRDTYGNTKLRTAGVEGFQLIALDCRGHGKSDKPHDPAMYGAEMAADVVRLLDHLHIKKAHLIGYSSGAFIAGKVAATHPERVLSVVYGGQAPLIAGAPSLGSNEVDVFAKAVEDGKGLGPYIVAVSPSDKPKPTLDQANAIAKFLYAGKDVAAFAAAGRSFGQLAVTAKDLKKCQAPALFLYGENESAYVKDSVAAALKVVPHGEVRVVPGGDHITTLIKPEFGASIIAFLLANRSR
ncbi:alpha/beta hydrolase [soil metagenome]